MNRRERSRQKKKHERQERLRREKHLHPPSPQPATSHPPLSEHVPLDPPRRYSPFLSERGLRRMALLTAGQDFQDLAAAQRFYARFQGQKVDEIGQDLVLNDPRERAQELAYRAMEAEDEAQSTRLAKEAVALDPDCVDALATLAGSESRSFQDIVSRLERALDAGARALGGEAFFAETRGRFWGQVFTRPYMRTRIGLAHGLREAGQLPEATAHYEALLDLNPRDNQGARYPLLGIHLERRDLPRARDLFSKYPDDGMAVFCWGRVLERFLSDDLRGAASALRRARERNPWVEEALLREPPRDRGGEGVTPGGESEAAEVSHCLGRAWRKHPQALAWLEGGKLALRRPEERASGARSNPGTDPA